MRALPAVRDALWFDEVNTLYRASGEGLRGVLARIAQDVQAPLYDLLVHVLVRLGASGELAARLPAVLAGVALVPVTYALARRLCREPHKGPLVAALAAGWVAFQPFLVRMGSEGRPYALLALLAALAWDAVARLRASGGRRGAGRLALASTLAVLCHYYGILAVAAIAVVLVASLDRIRPGLARVIAALGAPLVALVLWSPAALYQFRLKEMNALYRPLFARDTGAELLDAHGWLGGAEPRAWALVSRGLLVALLVLGLAVRRRACRARAPSAAPPPIEPIAPVALALAALGAVLLGAGAIAPPGALASLASEVYKGGRPLDADNLAFLAQVRTLLRVEGLVVLGLAALVGALPALGRRARLPAIGDRGLLVLGLLVPFAATAVVEAAGKHTLMTRNTIVLAPLLAIAAARGLAALPPLARAGAIAALALLLAIPARDGSVSQPRPDWTAAAAHAAAYGGDVVAYPPWLGRCLDYHLGQAWGTTFGSWRADEVAAWVGARPRALLVRSFEPLHPPHAIRSALVAALGAPAHTLRVDRLTCEGFGELPARVSRPDER